MALTINTNISSIIAQRSLNKATNGLNDALEKMSTGYKINHAKDNAAGYSIANQWVTKLGSLDVAADNAATGSDMLTTAEESYNLLTSHLQRVRDLTEQAANGTYGSQSLRAIQSEIAARLQEVNRLAANAEFNGIKLMKFDTTTDADNSDVGITEAGVNLQVGLYADKDSIINLDIELFKDASLKGLFTSLNTKKNPNTSATEEVTLAKLMEAASNKTITIADFADSAKVEDAIQAFACACSGLTYTAATKDLTGKVTKAAEFGLETNGNATPKEMLYYLDEAINDISDRVTKIGAVQNRVQSAISALDVQSQNLTSSLSTLRDTDVAETSSNYIQQQILQQASATLLSTANQLPSMALNLI